MYFKVILVGSNAYLGTKILETPGSIIFIDNLQMGCNITLDARNVRKLMALQG